jgi:hypothetical protein
MLCLCACLYILFILCLCARIYILCTCVCALAFTFSLKQKIECLLKQESAIYVYLFTIHNPSNLSGLDVYPLQMPLYCNRDNYNTNITLHYNVRNYLSLVCYIVTTFTIVPNESCGVC